MQNLGLPSEKYPQDFCIRHVAPACVSDPRKMLVPQVVHARHRGGGLNKVVKIFSWDNYGTINKGLSSAYKAKNLHKVKI